MSRRKKECDVLNMVDVTDYVSVCNEVLNLFDIIFPKHNKERLTTAFKDFNRLFNGEYIGFHHCDTAYHDIQHTLDMTLALARLIYGYEKQAPKSESVSFQRAELAIICALFHDAGYIRVTNDNAKNGAEYTTTHVTRSASFLSKYLPSIGLGDMLFITNNMVHFTGYELSIDQLKLQDEKYQLLGYMLGTADLMAQMSDRCYLEKCRDRLYPEFVIGGVDKCLNEKSGQEEALYSSAEDLLFKTPDFYYQSVLHRLNSIFQQCYRFTNEQFGGKEIYMTEVEKNIQYLKLVLSKEDFSLLRRQPLPNLATMEAASPYLAIK